MEYGALSPEPTPLPLFPLLGKLLTIRGYVLFEITQDPERLKAAKNFVVGGLASGALKPIIAKTFPLEDPARRVGMSVRNFVRRFKHATGDSPLIYLQKLRVAAAKRMLESNHRSMQEISGAVGYQDATDLLHGAVITL